MTFNKKFVELSKEKLAYLDIGSGEPLVLLHGNFCSSMHFASILPQLSQKYRCIVPDMRGFGDSTYNNTFDSMAEIGEDVVELLAHLGIDSAHFAGWSAGGCVCMQLAATYPALVRSFFGIASGSLSGYPVFAKDSMFQPMVGHVYASKQLLATDAVQVAPMAAVMEHNDTKAMRDIWSMTIFNVNKPEEEEYEMLMQETVKQKCLVDLDWALCTFNLSHTNNYYVDGDGTVDNIKCPCAFTLSQCDITVPAYMVMENVNGIAGSKLITYANSGHCPMVDCPEQLIVDMLEFFAGA